MAVVNGYCTTQDVRNQMGDAGTGLSLALLERAVNAASRAIDKHCKRHFWLDTGVATRTYIVEDPWCVYVDDIGARAGVVVKTGNDGITFPTTLTSGTQYILEPRNADQFATTTFDAFAFTQIRMIGSAFPYPNCTRPTMQVTAKFGWSAIPDDVVEACIIKATSLFKRKDAPFGVAGFGEFGVVRITRVDTDVIDLLADYVIPVA
jgi:hypothetical protein